MKRTVVKLKQNRHANLDSFPFRYGFYSQTDIDIELINIQTISNENIHDSKKRYGVLATFNLPNFKESLRGKFIISKRDSSVITVIREGSLFKTEHFLSETLKILREGGDINPQDLIDMYKEKIRTHVEVVKYLSNKIGKKKVFEAENSANEKIERISKILQSSREEICKKDEHIEYLDKVVMCAEFEKEEADEKIIELEKKLEASEAKNSIFSTLSKTKERPMNKYDYSGTDWSKESITSGVFKSYSIQGDYLVVTLHVAIEDGSTIIREIKCKNTHAGDYEKAVNGVKILKDGDMITYTTRGVSAYGSEWFYKIEKDEQSESKSGAGIEREASQYTSPNNGGINTDDSNFGYYDHDTDFDIDDNGNIKGKL